MVDPISAFGMATAAFNAIKKGFEVGRDVAVSYTHLTLPTINWV